MTKSSLEPTATERRGRVAEILAVGLVRLKRRGMLAVGRDDDAANKTSLPISGDSPTSRLESSGESGLTVHDG